MLLGTAYHSANGIVLIAACILDYAFGDPLWFPHPVRGIGWLAQRGEAILRRLTKTPGSEKTAGAILVILVITLVFAVSQSLIFLAHSISSDLGFIFSALLAYTTLAARGLADAARGVRSSLDHGDIERSRAELGMIVGRDTAELDEQGISRAVIETVAENTSDGVIAPLFYLALGGPALALAYKAVNTLDSMIGYKNDRYVNFGWAAARLDDAVNYIPARVTAILICLASNMSLLCRPAIHGPHATLPAPWRIMLRDGRRHPSPNSGYPEAAMAGALGVGLGGPSAYGGCLSMKPVIGDSLHRLEKIDIDKAVRLMYSAVVLALLGAAALNFIT